ncbi:MAG TPA: hypothetical protein VES39_12795 [Rhodospirillales bacterium]|nr:hypothetical protein [Rhodospirillales bacterium]
MAGDDAAGSPIARIGHELALAQQALHEPGAGAMGNLECRVADLQSRLLSTPARTPAEVAARLAVATAIVRSLGPRGYLLDLIEACINDLHALPDAAWPETGPRDPTPAADGQRTA